RSDAKADFVPGTGLIYADIRPPSVLAVAHELLVAVWVRVCRTIKPCVLRRAAIVDVEGRVQSRARRSQLSRQLFDRGRAQTNTGIIRDVRKNGDAIPDAHDRQSSAPGSVR